MEIECLVFPDNQSVEVKRQSQPEDTALKIFWDALDVGVDRYHAAVAGLAISTGCPWIAITNFFSSKNLVRVMAMWNRNDFFHCHEYNLEGTPCELVMNSEAVLRFSKPFEKFPQDAYLRDQGVNDYMGLSFRNKKGVAKGHITIMDEEPFTNVYQIEKTLKAVQTAFKLEL